MPPYTRVLRLGLKGFSAVWTLSGCIGLLPCAYEACYHVLCGFVGFRVAGLEAQSAKAAIDGLGFLSRLRLLSYSRYGYYIRLS